VAITTSSAGSVRRSVTTRRTFPASPSSRSSDSPGVDRDPLPAQRGLGDPAIFASKSCGKHVAEPFDDGGLQIPGVGERLGHLEPIAPAPMTTACRTSWVISAR